MLIYLALEEIEQRYTKMMNTALMPHVDRTLYPKMDINMNTIETGQFLDVTKTILFKNKQMEMLIQMFHSKEITGGDIILVGDIFYPGIEAIRYMADLSGIKIKIAGFNYAGRADKYDFVQELGQWADWSERGYHDICDAIFVGSNDHKERVIEHFGGAALGKVHVTGLVWDRDFVNSVHDYSDKAIREDRVVWPHRITKEKGIDDLLSIAKKLDFVNFIIPSSGVVPIPSYAHFPKNIEVRDMLTKQEYYEILNNSRWYLSTAYQETFGYTIQEAIHYGCEIFVPARACNPEMVPYKNVYSTESELVSKLSQSIDKVDDFSVPLIKTERFDGNAELITGICRRL